MSDKIVRIGRSEIVEILKKGKNYSSPSINLKVMDNSERRVSCFAYVVSSKVAKKAVERNKIKRRARFLIEKYKKEIKKDKLGVFLFKKGPYYDTFAEQEKNMLTIMKKAGILH